MKLYVAGPMSFRKDTDFNYPAFKRATHILRSAHYEVLCPTEACPDGSTGRPWQYYMRLTLAQVLQADGIAYLDENVDELLISSGATVELIIARALQMPIHSVDRWIQIYHERKVNQDA